MDETRFVDLRDADARGEVTQASAQADDQSTAESTTARPAAATDGGNPTSDTKATTGLSGVPVVGSVLALLAVLTRHGWHAVGEIVLVVWRVVRLPAVVVRRHPVLTITVLLAIALIAFVLARGGV